MGSANCADQSLLLLKWELQSVRGNEMSGNNGLSDKIDQKKFWYCWCNYMMDKYIFWLHLAKNAIKENYLLSQTDLNFTMKKEYTTSRKVGW